MTDQKLRPCPFCGTAEFIIHDEYVFPDCHCLAEDYEDSGIHRDTWQQRPIETALRAKMNRMRALLVSAGNALRSYQYSNVSPEPAREVADAVDVFLQEEIKDGCQKNLG